MTICRKALLTTYSLVLLGALPAVLHAGTIDNIICDNARFTVVASPEGDESCRVESLLTIRGASGLPQTNLVSRANTNIPLRLLRPNDIASVRAVLTCDSNSRGTQTVTERSNNTSNGCNATGDPQRPVGVDVRCADGRFDVSSQPVGNQNCNLDVQLNVNGANRSPAAPISIPTQPNVTVTPFPLNANDVASISATLTCTNQALGIQVSDNASADTVTGCSGNAATQVANFRSTTPTVQTIERSTAPARIVNPARTQRLQDAINNARQNCNGVNDNSAACQNARNTLNDAALVVALSTSVIPNNAFSAALADEVNRNCGSVVDQSPACVNSRNRLFGEVARNVLGNGAVESSTSTANVDQSLINDIRQNCSSPTDQSQNCQNALSRFLGATGRNDGRSFIAATANSAPSLTEQQNQNERAAQATELNLQNLRNQAAIEISNSNNLNEAEARACNPPTGNPTSQACADARAASAAARNR